jgi:hypothetical protein
MEPNPPYFRSMSKKITNISNKLFKASLVIENQTTGQTTEPILHAAYNSFLVGLQFSKGR